ncbi:MAG: MlaD family protein [Pseudomonadota bacterium]
MTTIQEVQIGTPVLYRGVSVGRVMSITPKPNSVDVGLEITERSLRMPNAVRVETVESGLIGEISIEITPLVDLTAAADGMSPVGRGCDSGLILCDGARLDGEMGPSYEELLRSASALTKLYADPELLAQLKDVLATVTVTSENAGRLAQEATAPRSTDQPAGSGRLGMEVKNGHTERIKPPANRDPLGGP